MAHLAKDNRKLVARVRRIGGQVAALERALTPDADCGAVLHQLAAVRGAVNGLMLQVLEGHLREHVAPANRRGQAELEPVMAVLRSYLK
ncbi:MULTISPECIES: metal/formaldehyde-sensitive transcriptional repressor [unclassified Rhodanobacter]|jgi:DNA-binding FrmR family transcriptional regulator|uniref:Metal/formaldehyde-sensitive transcriptional repressor n=1 Tax=Rhodanobacter humi TaxID=1888173 RepID=A0ABV4AWF3_9GAMM